MCGRARCTLRPDDFLRACYLNGNHAVRHLDMNRYLPSYNIAPGFNVPVVRRDEVGDSDGAVLHCMRWGLIPSFTNKSEKPDHFRMFNARSESIREKASFRRLLPSNRCLVSVEGFYEWKKDGSRKQPYYIHFKDGRPLVFAALFDSWKSSKGEIIFSFTIVTTSSSSHLEWLHDRMPVVLSNKESTDSWLNGYFSSSLDKILKSYEGPDLAWYPVTPAMGKLSCNGTDCIKEIQLKTEDTKSISHFFTKKLHGSEPKLGNTVIKREVEEVGANKSKLMNDEPERQTSAEDNILKDEPAEYVKEELDRPEDGNATPSSKGASSNTASKRYYDEFLDTAKPFGKETVTKFGIALTKRGKGAVDKQPTLFSYFGQS